MSEVPEIVKYLEENTDTVLIPYLRSRPWFCESEEDILQVELEDFAHSCGDQGLYLFLFWRVIFLDRSEIYFLPLIFEECPGEAPGEGSPDEFLALITVDRGTCRLRDAFRDASFQAWFSEILMTEEVFECERGELLIERTGAFESSSTGADGGIAAASSAGSPLFRVRGGRYGLDIFRHLAEGGPSAIEVLRLLSTRGFQALPGSFALASYESSKGEGVYPAAVLYDLGEGAVNGRDRVFGVLRDFYREFASGRPGNETLQAAARDYLGPFLETIKTLGRELCRMHQILSEEAAARWEPEDTGAAKSRCLALLEQTVRENPEGDFLRRAGERFRAEAEKLAGLESAGEKKILRCGRLGIRSFWDRQGGWVLVPAGGDLRPDPFYADPGPCRLEDAADLLCSLEEAAFRVSPDGLKNGEMSGASCEPLRTLWQASVRRSFLEGYFGPGGPGPLAEVFFFFEMQSSLASLGRSGCPSAAARRLQTLTANNALPAAPPPDHGISF